MIKKTGIIIAVAAVLLAIVSLCLLQKRRSLDLDIAKARERLAQADYIEVSPTVLSPVDAEGIKLFQNFKPVHDLVRHGENYFAATVGGLVEYDLQGRIRHTYTVLDGLPSCDLTALASYGGQLFIGTSNGKLIGFNGFKFIEYRFGKKKLQRITALTQINGELFIGAAGLGIAVYDGQKFTSLRKDTMVTVVAGGDTSDYFGTFDDGLLVKREGRWLQSATAEGLPSNRITGIAAINEQVYIGTDFGIAQLDKIDAVGERIKTSLIATLPGLSGLVAYGERIYVCRENGEVYSLDPQSSNTAAPMTLIPIERRWPSTRGAKLRVLDDNLFLFSDSGIWVKTNQAKEFHRFGDKNSNPSISENTISALALDGEGRLWAGFFSGGIDVLSQEGELIAHLETEAIREINCLRWDNSAKRMFAATSSGLFEFDLQFRSRRFTVDQGLASNSISQVNFVPSATLSGFAKPGGPSPFLPAVSTARGFSVGNLSGFRSYTTLQGLPSNSVYSAEAIGRKLFIGTLSGIAVIEGGQVTRTYKQSNSKLSADWVTALHNVDNFLFIGTYGGGVDILTPDGEIENLQSDIGKFEVNMNAIAADDTALYVGTLDSGLWRLDLRNRQWRQIKDGLPSHNVMALAASSKYLFVGTELGLARIEHNAKIISLPSHNKKN